MYYLMGDNDEILDSWSTLPNQEQVDNSAKMFGCDVWVMCGEHTGMTGKFIKEEKTHDSPID